MAGRHVRTELRLEDEVGPFLHDVCTCGRKSPQRMSRSELASEAKAWRGVQRAAAKLRITTDRKLGVATPQWVVDLALETGEPELGPGWEQQTVARLERQARSRCPCRCHGRKTKQELDAEARGWRNYNRAGARLRRTADAKLGRPTKPWILRLADEEDE